MKAVFLSLLEKMLLNIPWPEVLADAWKYTSRVFQGMAHEGMCEVLEMESTLELLNEKGTAAVFNKRKHVRYLQNDTIAFQDYAWGDGKILMDYRCSPGKRVDQYRLGYKTFVLISLQEVKSRGDEDEFQMQWKIKDGFLVNDGFWETDISQRTERIKVSVIFPKMRPPKRAVVIETNQRRTNEIARKQFELLQDGRVKVSWVKEKPRLYEHYLLKWVW